MERAILVDIKDIHIWSGSTDFEWNSTTYKPGILLGEDVPSGERLPAGGSPGLEVYLNNVPNLRNDVKSGDDVDLHVVENREGVWTKIGGYWAIVNEVKGPIESLTIETLPPFERFTKVTRPKWSNEDYISRYPRDNFFKHLDSVRNDAIKVVFY